MNDDKIIELFFRRDEQAIRESITTYGTYCRAVVGKILSDHGDVEEVLADTWIGAWNTIPPQRPKDLRSYLGRIARNRAVDLLRRKGAECRGGAQVTVVLEELGECVAHFGCPEQELAAKELGEVVNRFLKERSQQHRSIFLRRYFYVEEISSIACFYGLREANVRMILSRTRKKLRNYLIQEGYL
jgi:RNA polymerase sigma-70 factor (ECF subfamily)